MLLGLIAAREANVRCRHRPCPDEGRTDFNHFGRRHGPGAKSILHRYARGKAEPAICWSMTAVQHRAHCQPAGHPPISPTTVSTACSSSANAIMLADRLLRHHLLDAVVVGGVTRFCRFTINGFSSLMILDKERCRPFDALACGLNLKKRRLSGAATR